MGNIARTGSINANARSAFYTQLSSGAAPDMSGQLFNDATKTWENASSKQLQDYVGAAQRGGWGSDLPNLIRPGTSADNQVTPATPAGNLPSADILQSNATPASQATASAKPAPLSDLVSSSNIANQSPLAASDVQQGLQASLDARRKQSRRPASILGMQAPSAKSSTLTGL
jgi:hypothetical protein